MSEKKIPREFKTLILGGGIHGVGVLHDLVSRGFKDVCLVEKSTLGSGTSSRSTKLIHGGLRYLKHVSQFRMVSESLKERKLLMNFAPDIVKPIELYLPILKTMSSHRVLVKSGLLLYDILSGAARIQHHKRVPFDVVEKRAPILDTELFSKCYSFWDGQTDDYALVLRVANLAKQWGGDVIEKTKVSRIRKNSRGWLVELEGEKGKKFDIQAKYLVNCLGPWANEVLARSKIKAPYEAINNKGIHLLLDNIGLQVGLLLQSHEDKRIFFVLPWMNQTLVGTTESLYKESPDKLSVTEEEVNYLVNKLNPYLKEPIGKNQVISSFAGLRWLPVEQKKSNITNLSREVVIAETSSGLGKMYTVYGGKLTSYRLLAQKIGDKILRQEEKFRKSETDNKKYWNTQSSVKEEVPGVYSRFKHLDS